MVNYLSIYFPRNHFDFGTGCARFDRGTTRNDLRVIAVERDIKCTSKRYRRWRVYDAFMIFIWPVGAVLCVAMLLFKNRAKLNPALTDEAPPPQTGGATRGDGGFEREKRRHARAMGELRKLKLRSADDSISGLEFLFEEIEPRCYLFPVCDSVETSSPTKVGHIFFD